MKHGNPSQLNEKSLTTMYIYVVRIVAHRVYVKQHGYSGRCDDGCIYDQYTSQKVKLLRLY